MREPLRDVQNFVDRRAPNQSAATLSANDAPQDDNAYELFAGECFDSYKLIRKIGSGGMGVVYLAEDRELKRQVALKLLPKEFLADSDRIRRFQQEAHLTSQLNHPNILTVHCVGQTEKLYYIVTELVEGATLRGRILRSALSIHETLDIAIQIALALAAAQKSGVVHRDIKPENIMIRADGLVKVLDFGLAKLVDAAQINETSAGMILGTPSYLAPEQIENKKVDSRTDFFALGAVLYECLTGRTAFRAATVQETLAQIIKADLPAPSTLNPQVPIELDAATLKLLEKNPSNRFQTADEIADELRRIAANLSAAEQARTLPLAQPAATTNQIHAFQTAANFVKKPARIAAFASVAVLFAILIWTLPALFGALNRTAKPSALKSFEAGTAALRDGAYYKAGKQFEDAIAADPNFALAHARLAEAWSELDYTARAGNEMLQAQKLRREQQPFAANWFKSNENLQFDAIDALVRRDFGEAANLYRRIADASPENANCFVDLGRALEKSEDSTNAIKAYETAVTLDNGDAAAHLRLGVLRNRGGDFKQAFADFDRAEQLYDRASDDEGVAETHFERGRAYNLQDDHDRARREFDQILNNPRANRYQQIKTMLQISSVCSGAGDISCAKDFAARAVDFARAERMLNLATAGLIDLGNAYLARGEFDEAEKQFQQALTLARTDDAERNAARALLALGSLRIEENKPEAAETFVNQALPFFEQGNYRREVSQAQILLGKAKEFQNDLKTALNFYEQAEQFDDLAQRAVVQMAIGGILKQQNRLSDALVRYEQSLRYYNSTGNSFFAAYNLIPTAEILIDLHNFERAKQSLDAANKAIAETEGAEAQLSDTAALLNAQILLFEAEPARVLKDVKPFLESKQPYVATEANRLACLAQIKVKNSQNNVAIAQCRASLRLAVGENNQNQINAARLALAEAELNAGQHETALQTAQQVAADCLNNNQNETAWRATLVAARAAQSLKADDDAKKLAMQSLELLNKLKNDWNAADYAIYVGNRNTTADIARAKEIAAL